VAVPDSVHAKVRRSHRRWLPGSTHPDQTESFQNLRNKRTGTTHSSGQLAVPPPLEQLTDTLLQLA